MNDAYDRQGSGSGGGGSGGGRGGDGGGDADEPDAHLPLYLRRSHRRQRLKEQMERISGMVAPRIAPGKGRVRPGGRVEPFRRSDDADGTYGG